MKYIHPAARWASLQCLCLLGHSFRNLKRKKALILKYGRFQTCRQLSWKRFLRELISRNQINIFLIWKGQSHNKAVLAILELYRKVRRQSPFCTEFKWICYCKRSQNSRVNSRDSQEQMNRGKLLLETFWDYIYCSFIHRFFPILSHQFCQQIYNTLFLPLSLPCIRIWIFSSYFFFV